MKSSNQTGFMGHPKGLFYLFFAELWERFSFYGMRALLVLYMTKQLLYSDKLSFGVYAAYMSLVYFTPLIGGIISDRYLGYRKAITLGGIFMSLGHFFLSIETSFFFFGSLALIIVGNGLFKPNISTFVGKLYAKEDLRRDSGFTIFYMGINIGGAVAPLLCAYIAELYGWHYGFVLAGIGMIVGLLFFQRGIRQGIFEDKGLPPLDGNLSLRYLGITRERWITIISFASVPLFAGIIYFNEYEHYLVWIVVALIIALLVRIYRSVEAPYKSRLLVVAYVTIIMSLFWAIFEQAGSSLTLFADRNVRLIGLNASQTNSINSTFIILVAIPFSMLWQYLSDRKSNPSSAIKIGIGMILLGVGFVIFGASAQSADADAMTPMWYLFLGYFVLTLGEMFISPIGLSKMTELSAPKYLSFIMGVFFTSSFFGHYFAGKISKLTDVQSSDTLMFSDGIMGSIVSWVTGMTPSSIADQDEVFLQLYSYVSVYVGFGVIAIGVGLIALLFTPIIQKWMSGVQ